MLYYLVRPVARYVLGYYFRNIDITGLENIPKGKAVILAANHPTAFIEPCLLACFQDRSLHFLARGDLYTNRFTTALLRALNILPVYRMQDGTYSDLSRNYATFNECFKVLSKNKALMILAEGRCIHEKRLRPLRKGTARIALGALDKDATLAEVYVVPVGINFSAADQVRSTVMIRCGEPLLTSDFLSAYRLNEAGGLREFTAALHDALSPLVVQIPDRSQDDLYETVLEMNRNSLPRQTGVTHSGRQLEAALSVSRNPLPDRENIAHYASRLRLNGIEDRAIAKSEVARPKFWKVLLGALAVIPQAPFWLLAELLATLLPKHIEFYSPVRFAVIAVGTMLYLPLLFIIPYLLGAYLIISLIFTKWSLQQLAHFMAWRDRTKVDRLVPAEKQIITELRHKLMK